MKSRILSPVLVGLMCLSLAWASPLVALDDQMSSAGQITLDFRDVELTDLVQTISELTGRNFLYDDTVKGKVTIISPESMTLDEAYQLFLSVLYVKGYTTVPSGKVNKIVPIKNAQELNLLTVLNGRKMLRQRVWHH